jgi:hypothetical protein
MVYLYYILFIVRSAFFRHFPGTTEFRKEECVSWIEKVREPKLTVSRALRLLTNSTE